MNKNVIAFFKWLSHAFSEKDPIDNDMRFSIGRTSFVAWFWTTLVIAFKYSSMFANIPVYFWLLGFSLLGYVIGKEFLVLSFAQKMVNGNGDNHDADSK